MKAIKLAALILIIGGAYLLVRSIRMRQIAKSEVKRDAIVEGVAKIASAFRIPVIATTGQQPLRSASQNPINLFPEVYGIQEPTSFPRDTGSNALSTSGSQKTSIRGGPSSWI